MSHLEDVQECRKLLERIAQVERDQRCVHRVAALLAGITFLAGITVGYGVVFHESYFYGGAWLAAKLTCDVGIASLICFVGVAGLGMSYRRKLNGLLHECRTWLPKLMELRQGSPSSELLSFPAHRQVDSHRPAWPASPVRSTEEGAG